MPRHPLHSGRTYSVLRVVCNILCGLVWIDCFFLALFLLFPPPELLLPASVYYDRPADCYSGLYPISQPPGAASGSLSPGEYSDAAYRLYLPHRYSYRGVSLIARGNLHRNGFRLAQRKDDCSMGSVVHRRILLWGMPVGVLCKAALCPGCAGGDPCLRGGGVCAILP